MIEFTPHYDEELEVYINSHPMFCEENTHGRVICKADFYHYICEHKLNILNAEFEDVDYALWMAGSLKCKGYHNKPVEITWDRINEFFTHIEPLWKEFHGKPSGFELRNPNNTVMLADDEDFVV